MSLVFLKDFGGLLTWKRTKHVDEIYGLCVHFLTSFIIFCMGYVFGTVFNDTGILGNTITLLFDFGLCYAPCPCLVFVLRFLL